MVVTSVPPTVTVGAAVAPVILISVSPPLTSCGIDDSTWMLIAAAACVAANATQMAAHEAATFQVLLDIGSSGLVRDPDSSRGAATICTAEPNDQREALSRPARLCLAGARIPGGN